jgi:hypothetical protein
VRTVRKVARARNRPRRGLAWSIAVALILLVLVATRASAEPAVPDEELDDLEAALGELAPEERALLDELAEDLDDDDVNRLVHHTLDPEALRDVEDRTPRRSRWGQLDLTIAWRRTLTDDRTDAVWLFATWRR